jgi:CRISPR-associated endonuclease/helicase Cas3
MLFYHSRYRYEDRVDHHRAVISAFKPGAPLTFWFKWFRTIQDLEEFELWWISFLSHLIIGLPVLAITTQVAEMSLDLSATLLITQIANPAALIQRIGRLNRKYCGRALDAIFYPERKEMVNKPYKQHELEAGKAMVELFQSQAVNQAQLATWLEGLNVQGKPKDQFVWLDGKWRTYPASLREAGYTVTALLEGDPEWTNKKTGDLPRYTVPLPTKNVKGWKRHKKGYPIAPINRWGYSSDLGAYELKQREKV